MWSPPNTATCAGARVADQVEVLIDGVGGAPVPELADAHLGRDDLDVLAEARQPPVARRCLIRLDDMYCVST